MVERHTDLMWELLSFGEVAIGMSLYTTLFSGAYWVCVHIRCWGYGGYWFRSYMNCPPNVGHLTPREGVP